MPPTSKAGIKRELARHARHTGSFDASRYFRGAADLRFYNTGTRAVRELAAAIYRTQRDGWSINEALVLADDLVQDPYLETKSVGIELLARYRQQFAPRLLPVWKRWLARGYSSNWATTDAICGCLIGPLLIAYPSLVPKVAAWSSHPNM